MKKIFLHRFHGLNNYGSAMMGLVMMEELYKRLNGAVEFYFYNSEEEDIHLIHKEFPHEITLKEHKPVEPDWSRFKWVRSYQKRKHWFDTTEIKDYDAVIVLGGDDLSEYYTQKIYPDLIKYWAWNRKKPTILFGQTMGPFHHWKNKLVIKYLYKNIPIFTRDKKTKNYLESEFGLKQNVFQGADLAFMDLPKQSDFGLEKNILNKYGLTAGKYITVVISGLQGKYYTNDREIYLSNFKQLIESFKEIEELKDLPVVLLAHTFPPHGDEPSLIKEFIEKHQPEHPTIIPVTEKIGPTGARFILGHGLFTITGRMHAAISTFQMGKPAISLSYSTKYEGVIGKNLRRSDLIIDANHPRLWNNGSIVKSILEKIKYILSGYEQLTSEINHSVISQKEAVHQNLDKITRFIQ